MWLRCGSDPALLWLWCRLTAAAPVQPLAQELPFAAGVAVKRKKTKTKKTIKIMIAGYCLEHVKA